MAANLVRDIRLATADLEIGPPIEATPEERVEFALVVEATDDLCRTIEKWGES